MGGIKVVLVNASRLEPECPGGQALIEESGYDIRWNADPDEMGEAAGRLCYRSFHRPNPKTAENADYLNNIKSQMHFSVLEHSSVTFYVAGVSRALLLELERHRHFSYSVVSQRYCDVSEDPFVEHPVLNDVSEDLKKEVEDLVDQSRDLYTRIVENLQERGHSRKEARGAARLILPEGTTTELFISGNLRAWREMIEKRNTKYADAEIRVFAQKVLRQLKWYAPNTFSDMEV
jgi:thymidylate synthase (FAD)